jgi:hypothetical protein
LHQLVDLLVIVVMAEHQQHCVNVARLCQAHDQVPQVDDARVYLWQGSETVSRHCRGAECPLHNIVTQDRSA